MFKKMVICISFAVATVFSTAVIAVDTVRAEITEVIAGVRGSRIMFTIKLGGTLQPDQVTAPSNGVPLEGGQMLQIALQAHASGTDVMLEFIEPRGGDCEYSDKVCIDYISKIWFPTP